MKPNDAKKFRDEQKIDLQSVQLVNSRKAREEDDLLLPQFQRKEKKADIIEFKPRTVGTAKKGTAHRANNNRRKRKSNIKAKIAAAILSAIIGIGAINVVGNFTKGADRGPEQPITITQLEDHGIDVNKIGLEQDTVEMMEHYDEYFSNIDYDSVTSLTDNDVIQVAEDIRTLNFNTIKDKFADLRGVSREDIKLWYSFDSGDGSYNVTVRINEDSYDREIYSNSNGILFGLGKKNSIPQEISDLILQTGEYDSLISDLKSDKITKKNALKKLEELYREISENVATKDLTIDDKGNIGLEEYDNTQQNKDSKEVGDER